MYSDSQELNNKASPADRSKWESLGFMMFHVL